MRSGLAEPSLALVVQGGKRTVSGDRVFDYAAGEFLVTQLDLPVIGQVTAASAGRPFLGVGIRLEPAEIAAMILEAGAAVGGISGRRARHRRRERRTSRSWTRWRTSPVCLTPRRTCRSSRPCTGARCSGGC